MPGAGFVNLSQHRVALKHNAIVVLLIFFPLKHVNVPMNNQTQTIFK